MAKPPGGYTPNLIILCPASKKNSMDDLLYTIVQDWFIGTGGTPAEWAQIDALMFRNYNETFRDLLITWLRIIKQIRGI